MDLTNESNQDPHVFTMFTALYHTIVTLSSNIKINKLLKDYNRVHHHWEFDVNTYGANL